MHLDTETHHRRSIRLPEYDYSRAGAYFVTVCAHDRECLFGEVVNGEMRLSEYGRIVADTWEWLANQYAHVELDEWIIMPNHVHGIIVLTGIHDRTVDINDRTDALRRGGSRTAPVDSVPNATALKMNTPAANTSIRKPLGRIIGAFKTVSAKHINLFRNIPGATLWQRNYYEHVIRNEADLNRIREYIMTNPARWPEDAENPDNRIMP